MPAVSVSLSEIRAERERRERGEQLSGEAERLSKSLREFVRAAWPIIRPGDTFRPNWHIDAIVEHVEAAYRREIRRLMINVPPRHMKSLTTCVFAPAWRWTHRPEERMLTASFGSDLAERDATETRTLLLSPWYRARWGDTVRLRRDVNRLDRYVNDRGGHRIATGTKVSSATGEGGDVLIVDDPHRQVDAYSDAELEKVRRFWGGVWATRMNDPRTGVKIVIGQRIHESDLCGLILERGDTGDDQVLEWTHLCLPARYEPSHPFVWPDDPRSEPGELLWPEHIGERELAEITQDMTSFEIAGQLQQRPAPAEGGILKRAWWRYFPPEWLERWEGEPLRALLASWDTALKEKTTSDFTVGTLWGLRGQDRYLLRRFRARVNFPDTLAAVSELARWADTYFSGLPQTTLVELAANGPELVAKLRSQLPGVIGIKVETDKVSRAHAIAAQLEAGNVFVPGAPSGDGGYDRTLTPSWVQELVEECAGFPNMANDDQVDSVTQALLRAKGRYALLDEPTERPEPRAISAGILERSF